MRNTCPLLSYSSFHLFAVQLVAFVPKELERQIVGALSFGSRCWSSWERSIGRSGLGCCLNLRRCSKRCGLRCHATYSILCGVYLTHIKGTNAVVPTAVILMGIDVERHQNFLPHLHIETSQTVDAKHLEQHLLRVLLMGFNDIAFHFPFSTC